jgi:hypothetical protein
LQSAGTTAITVDTSQNTTFAGIQKSSVTSGNFALADQATSNTLFQQIQNSGNTLKIGVENSSGGGIFTGSGSFDAVIGTSSNRNLCFGVFGATKMMLDNAGNLLVGLTSAISSFSKTIQIQDSSSSALCTSITGANARNWFTGCNSSGLYGVYDATAGAYRLQIGTTGRVYIPNAYTETTGNSANLFVDTDGRLIRSTSSLKYKQNVQDATHGLTDLLKLRSVTYQGKSESDADKTFGGLIAEEVHDAGLTEFVQYAEDGSPDALAYGNMVSLCVKAIQELKAINDTQAETINALTARITALENA